MAAPTDHTTKKDMSCDSETDTPRIEYSKRYKCLIVGDRGVGKSAMVQRKANIALNIVPELIYKSTVITYNEIINTTVWDIDGAPKYDGLRIMSFDNTDVFILCYSVANVQSFKNVREKWFPAIKKHCPNASIILAGNKMDLREDTDDSIPFVSTKQGRTMAKQLSAKFFECSAINDDGLNIVFVEAARSAIKPTNKNKRKCNIM